MKETLKEGLAHTFSLIINETKLVPALYPESAEFQAMPNVFATGYMIGLIFTVIFTLICTVRRGGGEDKGKD